jgi:hypothetical protein
MRVTTAPLIIPLKCGKAEKIVENQNDIKLSQKINSLKRNGKEFIENIPLSKNVEDNPEELIWKKKRNKRKTKNSENNPERFRTNISESISNFEGSRNEEVDQNLQSLEKIPVSGFECESNLNNTVKKSIPISTNSMKEFRQKINY